MSVNPATGAIFVS
jgi:hypothetical protein